MKKSMASLWIASALFAAPSFAQVATTTPTTTGPTTPVAFGIPGSAIKGKPTGAADLSALQDIALAGFDEETKTYLKANPTKFSLASQLRFMRELPYLKLEGCKDCAPLQSYQVAPLIDLYGFAAILKNTQFASADEAKQAEANDLKAAEGTKTLEWNAEAGSKIWASLGLFGSTQFARTQLPQAGQVGQSVPNAAAADQTKKDLPASAATGATGEIADPSTKAAAEVADLDRPSQSFGKPLDFGT